MTELSILWPLAVGFVLLFILLAVFVILILENQNEQIELLQELINATRSK